MQDKPKLSDSGLSPTHAVVAVDQFGEQRDVRVSGESPLTIKVDDIEVVTLITLGTHPELLALGYLRNQRLIEDIAEIESVKVDWDKESVQVTTKNGNGISNWQEKLSKRTVTTGCGQGTVFSCTLDKLYDKKLAQVQIKQSLIYELLKSINYFNEIYKQAGAVHGCALCRGNEILNFV